MGMSEFDNPAPKRRKISLACVPCRERKIRCTGERPTCASCVRRFGDSSSECSYVVQSELTSTVTESMKLLLERLQRLENQSVSLPSEQRNVQTGQSFTSVDLERIDRNDVIDGNALSRNDSVSEIVESNRLRRLIHISTPLSAKQEIARRVPEPADLEASSMVQASEPLSIVTHDENSPVGLVPKTQSMNNQTVANAASDFGLPTVDVRSRYSSSQSVGDGAEHTWSPGTREQPQNSAQTVVNVADAMGASSVSDKDSPEESTQYYGGSSGIAFMRAISQVLANSGEDEQTKVIAPSTAGQTDTIVSNQIFRSELLNTFPTIEGPKYRPDHFALPSRSLSDHLLENYWTRVYPLYPFLHRPTFETAYAMLWNPPAKDNNLVEESDAGLGNSINAGPSTRTFYCALNMMLALGSQFSDIPVSQLKELTAMFEKRSKNLLIVDMMDRGCIAVVQTLLLTGQYLQSTFYPQRCWNSIGVACRIAQGLGLHVEEHPRQKAVLGIEVRRRVWYGCIMLDMAVSMTMGRPLMISHKFSTAPPSPVDDDQLQATCFLTPSPETFPNIRFFLEAIKLSKTLGVILTTIYDQTICSTSTTPTNRTSTKYVKTPSGIEALLELDNHLTEFQDELPVELRWGQDGDSLRQSLGAFIGNLQMQANVLHARFLQTRILLYRETFIQLCQDSVSNMRRDLPDDHKNSVEFDVDTFFATRCAVSCITSARDLIRLVHRTFQRKSADAWWYNVYYAHTSGMVMKLAQLCHPLKKVVETSSLDESWALCREILSNMNSYGPVAHRCLASLEEIQEKISGWERKTLKSKTRELQRGGTNLAGSSFPTPNHEEISPHDSMQHQRSEGQNETNIQASENFTDIQRTIDSTMPLSGSPFTTMYGETADSSWSTDLRDWWIFPVDFGFDNFSSV